MFEKHYPNRKDWRKPYVKGKPGYYDRRCRCNGPCTHCQATRLYQDRRERAAADKQLTDYMRGLHGDAVTPP